ncbi:TerB family tellurite resistance protein [Brachybacterium kimchii]|uniref:TerB family tellurite resistance protein n=1 Tax=Brachybacterium kimchii TaxID=2942909 RepID=A0ABY4N526_9MICO|nr:TerB family tellurite resistance protein [Brachybacterium kimchii]UQN29221.1 TerB family tellurite resistance protein [Brachybacterium kimchii]
MNDIEKTPTRAIRSTEKLRRRAVDAGAAAQSRLATTTRAARSRLVEAAGTTSAHVKTAAGSAQSTASDALKRLPLSRDRALRAEITPSELSADVKLSLCRELVALAQADGALHPSEISALYLLLTTMDLDPEARTELRGLIAAAQHTPVGTSPRDDALDAGHAPGAFLDDIAEEHREAVATAVVHQMVSLALSDGDISDMERAVIDEVATRVFDERGPHLVASIERLVEKESEFLAGRITTSQFETATKDIAAKAAAFGTPIAAISLFGSVTGLGAAGITSGLAALGFGGVLGLSSMMTGIGTVVILGVLVHQGTRYVLGTNERSRDTRREHLMQQVIGQHQRAIADLTDDIGALARRMEQQLARTTANEQNLADLRSDLEAFQMALADLQASKTAVEEQAAGA